MYAFLLFMIRSTLSFCNTGVLLRKRPHTTLRLYYYEEVGEARYACLDIIIIGGASAASAATVRSSKSKFAILLYIILYKNVKFDH